MAGVSKPPIRLEVKLRPRTAEYRKAVVVVSAINQGHSTVGVNLSEIRFRIDGKSDDAGFMKHQEEDWGSISGRIPAVVDLLPGGRRDVEIEWAPEYRDITKDQKLAEEDRNYLYIRNGKWNLTCWATYLERPKAWDVSTTWYATPLRSKTILFKISPGKLKEAKWQAAPR